MSSNVTFVSPSGVDDTTALQAAITAAIATGDPYSVVLSGEYTISSALAITSATRLSIEGVKATITQGSAAATFAFVGCTSCSVRGIRFVTTETVTSPVTIGTSAEVLVSDCEESGYSAVTTITSASTGSMAECQMRIHDVRAYGATGDGTTDDSAAVTAALAGAVAGGGGVVYFSEGTYVLAHEYNIPSRITIRGDGMQKTILKQKSGIVANNMFQIVSYPVYDDIVFEDFAINMNKSNTTDPSSDALGIGIYFASVNDGNKRCAIRRVRVYDAWASGVRLLGKAGSDAATVTPDCDVHVSEYHSSGCQHGLRATYLTRLNIDSCYCTDSTSGCGIIVNSSRGVNIRNCYCAANVSHGISLSYCAKSQVVNNYCESNTEAGIALGGGVPTDAVNDQIVIAGNVCHGNGWHGITCDPTRSDALTTLQPFYAVIANNVCTDSTTYHGIYINHCKYVTITGNLCTGNANAGIAVLGAYCTIVANEMYNNTTVGLAIQGAAAVAGLGYHSITGNSIHGNGTDITRSAYNVETVECSSERVQTSATGAVYFGDANTDGSWRIIRDGVKLVRQLRVGGNWVDKGTDTP